VKASAHPFKMKYNTALSFAKRVKTLSDDCFLEENYIKIDEILKLNNFPTDIIRKILRTTKYSVPRNPTTTTEKKSFAVVPYIPVLSERIIKKVTENHNNIRAAYKPLKTLANNIYTKGKTKIEKEDQAGVVYKINCGVCEKVYVGETGKRVKTRKKQHITDLENIMANPNRTAILTHTSKTKHKFDYNSIEILEHESDTKKRKILEASYIASLSPYAVNKKTDLKDIGDSFLSVLNTFSEKSIISPKRKKRKRETSENVNEVEK